VLYQETTEIVLVPSEILYKNSLNESEIKELFSDQMHFHFSMPLYLSDFTRQSQALTSIPDLIQDIWTRDEIIQPHHVISAILVENDFSIYQSKLKKYIDNYMDKNYLPINKSSRQIVSEGIKFLLKNKIIDKYDDNYKGIETEQIRIMADVLKRKKEKQGFGTGD
jgi:hypothetical protein